MSKPKILIQLDSDARPSVFDAVVAVDSGVDQLLQYGGVTADAVRDLVHGAIFTRARKDLARTALFIGGSDVVAGESILAAATNSFLGPLRVSVMLDSGGANTTAVAAVLCAARHLDLSSATALVLAATGPVGQRAVQLLARAGADVRVSSRSAARAQAVCQRVAQVAGASRPSPYAITDPDSLHAACRGVQLMIAAGTAGVQLVPREVRQACRTLQVAVDLNAVPPAGIAGVEPHDQATLREGVTCYGAIGVGGLKMRIHHTALERLFETNDLVLDLEAIYALGQNVEGQNLK